MTGVAWCPCALDRVVLCIEENGLTVWRGGGRKKSSGQEDTTIDRCRESRGKGSSSHNTIALFMSCTFQFPERD